MIKGQDDTGVKKELSEVAASLGIDFFRVTSADGFENTPEGHRPRDIMPDVKSIIILGMKLLDSQLNILPAHEREGFSSSRQDLYAGHSDIVSHLLDDAGYVIARSLERKGFKAYHVTAARGGVDQRYLMGLLSLKHLAVKAGLGVFGRHSLVITPQYGPRVRLTAILTDAEMEPDPPLAQNFCEKCLGNPCITLCPVKALTEPVGDSPYQINKYACRQYLNTRPACAICMKVCPAGSERVK